VTIDNPQGVTSVGNHPQGAPANMANLWSTYDFSMAGIRGFKVGAGLNYMAKSYSDITNVNSIPSFVIGNATFAFEKETWTFRLSVDNFTDRRYFVAANATGAYVGNPASVYGQVTLNLGAHK
jgi:iron complex outermembrane receptor protein